ncbi:MAG: dihydrolipoamide acetyltransferase family protein [Bacteroidetes bacterium]|nr:dihydrolipoamide acetyltransferase family protein [Bacteroidota bacterium]
MSLFKLVMPKLGESIIEATITRWMKAEGDRVNEDDPIIEIATDKVDSEIPSPVEGTLTRLLFKEGDIVPVGEVIALIDTGGNTTETEQGASSIPSAETFAAPLEAPSKEVKHSASVTPVENYSGSDRFYSPLVKNIARTEKVALAELDKLQGSGKEGRITKSDLLDYLNSRNTTVSPAPAVPPSSVPVQVTQTGDQVIEMDRMRKLIAEHMVMSVKTSPHVTSIVEVDMTNIVLWREKNKDILLRRDNEKLTFTHIFLDTLARTVREFPMVNASVEGTKMIIRKQVNTGMAVALPNGNLIVPVIRNADQLSLLGIVKAVNDIADRARNNKLQPDEVQGGTITLTNLGSFGTLLGTPIINQPQVAIVAVGSITKRPVVLETPQGDVIGVRHMMYMSLTYDHRIIDGALGGKFIFRMKELLEHFDINQTI